MCVVQSVFSIIKICPAKASTNAEEKYEMLV
jgi:hypothetical protein